MCKHKSVVLIKKVAVTIILAGSLLIIYSCKNNDEVIPDPLYITDKNLAIKEVLTKHYSTSTFYFGCISTNKFLETGNVQATIFNKEFSYNTPENQFKQAWVYIQPGAKWNSADYKGLINMARANKQVMRAHAPISPQSSKWAMDDARTPAELNSMATDFMTKMCKELEANSDVVKWLDVVNETVVASITSDSKYGYIVGDWFGPLLGTSAWENPWLIIGQENVTALKVPAYIETAFQIAKTHAPNVKKLYNQHGRSFDPAAWDKVKKTILYLRSKGYVVDALGWQAHVTPGFEKDPENIKGLNAIIDWCYYNKLEFHITELDVKLGIVPETAFKTQEVAIADTYAAIVKVMLKKIGRGAVGINCWTFNDRASSGDGGATAGLYDKNNNPNLCYHAIKETLLKNTPAK